MLNTKKILSSSGKIMTKAICALLIFSVSAFAVSPFANCEVKALSISIGVIQDVPSVLNVVSMSQLDYLIIQGVFSDRNMQGNKAKKASNVQTQYDFCMISVVQKMVENVSSIISSIIPGVMNLTIAEQFAIDNAYYSIFQYNNIRSLAILDDCLSNWMVTTVMPRGYTDGNLTVYKYIYSI